MNSMVGIWAQAVQLAHETRPERNRYIDFVRAFSILIVVVGHWLMSAFFYEDGRLSAGAVLEMQPSIQWLTWIFQVMPMFFIVGGYSNSASLQSARHHSADYAHWLAGRLRRLIPPLLLLVVAWGVLALVLHFGGVSARLLQFASRSALIPTWFLAIYVMVVVLAPATYELWRRWRFGSFWVFVAASTCIDLLFFAADLRWAGWINYFFVWLAVHQLGYAWRETETAGIAGSIACAVLGLLTLVALVKLGPYPLAMVGSPDEDVSNSLPPKLTLIALGLIQYGLLRAFERPARRLLSATRVWASVVLVNSMIMTLYLWHLTVMVIVVALADVAGGFGLRAEPLSNAWWWTRPAWIAVLAIVLLPVALLLSPLERRRRTADEVVPSVTRQVCGAALLCSGVALLARFGFGNASIPGLDVAAFSTVVMGAFLSGLLPALRTRHRR
jgi:peptidoglycan/LPS O-acetylase OafA/YrhL